MIPVIICSHNRTKLVKQSIESLKENSDHELQIIVVDDSNNGETHEYLKTVDGITYYHVNGPTTIGVSWLIGAAMAKPSEFIYFATEDIYYLPLWDKYVVGALEQYDDLVLVGGYGVHGGGEARPVFDRDVRYAGLQAGFGIMMRRKDWVEWGYFPNDDEDSWIGYQSRATGKKIGVIDPPVIVHTGYTSTHPVNSKITDIPHDRKRVEDNQIEYPEVYFE